MQKFLSVGGTSMIRSNVMASLAYTHGFQTTQSGPIIAAAGTIPASSVSNTISSDHVTASMNVLF
jgi:hypothetical protein